ncbi:hypothetical protein NOVO_00595 [Rickettsiales bacterium Ac37b]|nr:hypothetical protein NOVO_00595 [Rickettsiales bacterium Ac37b]
MLTNFIDDSFSYNTTGNQYPLESFALVPLPFVVNDKCIYITESTKDVIGSNTTSLLVPVDKCFSHEQYIFTSSTINHECVCNVSASNAASGNTIILNDQYLDDVTFTIDISAGLISSGKSRLLDLLANEETTQLMHILILTSRIDDPFDKYIMKNTLSISYHKSLLESLALTSIPFIVNDQYISMIESTKQVVGSNTTFFRAPDDKCFPHEQYIFIPSDINETENYFTISYKKIICSSVVVVMGALCYQSKQSLVHNTKYYVQGVLTYTAISMLEYKFDTFNTEDFVTDIASNLISCGKSVFLGLLMHTGIKQLLQSTFTNTPLAKNIIVAHVVEVSSAMLSTIPQKFVLKVESDVKNFYYNSDMPQDICMYKPQEQNVVFDAIYEGGAMLNKIMTKELAGPNYKV